MKQEYVGYVNINILRNIIIWKKRLKTSQFQIKEHYNNKYSNSSQYMSLIVNIRYHQYLNYKIQE